MRPRRARARARLDWTRSLIRMKTGLTGRKKSRRATAVRDQEQRRLPGKNNHTDRTTEADDSLSDQAAHRRRSLPLQNRDLQPQRRQRHRHPVKRLLRVRRIIPGVKSPVTEIQEPGIPETAMQQAPAVRQDRELNPNSGDIL